jgi:anti-sigma B factor antagonist
MELATTHHEHVTVIAIAGSVDSLTAEQLTRPLGGTCRQRTCPSGVRLQGRQLHEQRGLRSLLGALKESRRLGGDLRMAAVQPAVLRVLSLSGFASIIKIFDDVPGAVGSYGKGI